MLMVIKYILIIFLFFKFLTHMTRSYCNYKEILLKKKKTIRKGENGGPKIYHNH